MRKELFHYLDEFVFIMGKQNQVVDANTSARKWLAEIGFSGEEPCDFEQVIACVIGQGGVIKEGLVPSASRNIFMMPYPSM